MSFAAGIARGRLVGACGAGVGLAQRRPPWGGRRRLLALLAGHDAVDSVGRNAPPAAASCAAAGAFWRPRGRAASGRRLFTAYHTPASTSDPVAVEHGVRVSPSVAWLKPAFDQLRTDRESELSKDQVLQLCPNALPELVEGLFNTFDTNPRNGNISYDEISAFVLLQSDRLPVEEKLESLFHICDSDGVHVISREQFRGAVRMMYYALFKDDAYSDFKVDTVVKEAFGHGEGESLTLAQFTEWRRSDGAEVTELLNQLQKSIAQKPSEDDGSTEVWHTQAHVFIDKIKVENPVVEIDGDEMTRILWQMIKEHLIFPFLDMELDYYDLSITYRDETDDSVTFEAASAISKHLVGIKCATISPNKERMLEFNLQEMWKNPNSSIQRKLGGTRFLSPVMIDGLPKSICAWDKAIVLCHRGLGDASEECQLIERKPGTARMTFEGENGHPEEVFKYSFKNGGGSIMGTFNSREAMDDFAKCCFDRALEQELPLYLSTRSVSETDHDSFFVEVFDALYQRSYRKVFEERGLGYLHCHVSEMLSVIRRRPGGFVWGCPGRDADILAGVLSQGYCSPGMMVSALSSSDGKMLLTEAGHGTVTKHYRAFKKGDRVSTNPLASIFAWSRGLAHRAKLDGNEELARFSRALEEACTTCVHRGLMSKDLARCFHGDDVAPEHWLPTEDLLNAFANELRIMIGRPLRAPTKVTEPPKAIAE